MKIIAFYLPQYYPTPHNNEWWGEGFTEWTNVAKARKLFPGHYQPKIPADLGFYDLRVPEVREKQAKMAQSAGIYGFCYYHYWFGGGQQELELPFHEVVDSGKPDFPFCLCWANETWSRRFWSMDGLSVSKKTLIEQQYLGKDDDVAHFQSLLPAFRDFRYIKVDGKLLFMIYKPLNFPDIDVFIKRWNQLAKDNGLEGFYFVGYSLQIKDEYDQIKGLGFDGVCSCRIRRYKKRGVSWFLKKIFCCITRIPEIYSYKKVYPTLIGEEEVACNDVFPTIIPNWDHTARCGYNGYLFHQSTPELFEKHAQDVLGKIQGKDETTNLCFLKSWNEWGEGNYMEPDMRYQWGYLLALKKAIDSIKKK